jgi:hypothetical protein
MRAAHGWKWSRRRRRINVYLNGRLIAWQGEAEARSEQARGAFRHAVARFLLAVGFSKLAAMEFACLPVLRSPYK